MTNYFDDDSFWDEPTGRQAEPTSQISRIARRVPERTRSHHVVDRDTPRPSVDHDDAGHEMWLEPAGRFSDRGGQRLGTFGTIDPRLLSVGAIAIAAVLVVPLLGAIQGDDGDDGFRSVAEAETTVTTVAVTVAPTTVAEIVVTAAVTPIDDVDEDEGESQPTDDTEGGGTARMTAGDSAPSAVGAGEVAALRTPDGCANRYDVVAGDFWLGIAVRADVDVDDLLAANDASSATAIFPGSEVCLPDGASIGSGGSGGGATPGGAGDGAVDPATCGTTYDVTSGDYWVRIADASGTSLANLLAVNGATKESMLFPGTTICLPADATPPTTAAPTTAAPTTAPPATQAPSTDPPATQPAATNPRPTDLPTTDAPATDPPDTTQPQGPIPSGGEVEAMIREIWPDDLEEQALRIAWRESNYRPDVTSTTGCCVGVFQMHWEAHQGWLGGLGVTSRSQLFDARTNIQAAYALYQRNGWAPWSATMG